MLPDTDVDSANATLARLQRRAHQALLPVDNQRLLSHLQRRHPHGSRTTENRRHIGSADHVPCMPPKRSGKNRVFFSLHGLRATLRPAAAMA